MVRPSARYTALPVGRVLVLGQGPSPTVDFYLRPRLHGTGMPPVEYLDVGSPPPESAALAPPRGTGLFVVICRYITRPWLAWLESARGRVAGVAYFTDDDLPAMLRDSSLPLRYRFKIWRLYARHVRRLSLLASELWLASPALGERYPDHRAKLLLPLYTDDPVAETCPVRYFYHGTAAHGREVLWLADVVDAVQKANPRMVFEIIGDRRMCRLFRGIERVVVLHPMPWPTYLAHTANRVLDIGLAPLLPSAVNEARSPTKFFDIARAGAAGLYSDRAPYSGFVRDGEDGLLLPDDKDRWVEAILELAEDAPRRRVLTEAALLRCPRRDDTLLHLAESSTDDEPGSGGPRRHQSVSPR